MNGNGKHVRRSGWSRRSVLGLGAVAAAGAVAGVKRKSFAAGYEDVIPAGSFNSFGDLETHWHYLYPWGDTHNGTAKMVGGPADRSHVSLDGGALTLTATPVSEGGIHYHSGAVHAKAHIVVSDAFPEWTMSGRFAPPTVPGTWPAFWLNANSGWPPEIDILEHKGDAVNWCNTFQTATRQADTTKVDVGGGEHDYSATLTKVAGSADVTVTYGLDGRTVATHTAVGYAGQSLRLILNLQMEGSSGGPGPAGGATFRASNVTVRRLVA
ncbi:MAG TPA: hypothetical protein VF657_20290 [Actinoplanes sp.]|jgi:hypothetical protein